MDVIMLRVLVAKKEKTNLYGNYRSHEAEDIEGQPEAVTDEATVINDIIDTKRSSKERRDKALRVYCYLLRQHYVSDPEILESHMDELLDSFSHSISNERDSEAEAISGLRALALTMITTGDGTIYTTFAPLLKRLITISSSYAYKAHALHCLGTITFFHATGDDDLLLEHLDYLLKIITSDGGEVNASGDVETVAAAVEEWGFLATAVEDLESHSEIAATAFLDHLESDFPVQIAAGENLALLYEKSFIETENYRGDAPVTVGEKYGFPLPGGELLMKRYNAYENKHEVTTRIAEIANISDRQTSKKDRRDIHKSFSSILATLEDPRRGPYHNTAINDTTEQEYGSRHAVKLGSEGDETEVIVVERWSTLLRLAALKRVVQGGLVKHHREGNQAIVDCLPAVVTKDRRGDKTKDRGDKARSRS